MANYTSGQLSEFLERDDPPPASLTRRQVREMLMDKVVKEAVKEA